MNAAIGIWCSWPLATMPARHAARSTRKKPGQPGPGSRRPSNKRGAEYVTAQMLTYAGKHGLTVTMKRITLRQATQRRLASRFSNCTASTRPRRAPIMSCPGLFGPAIAIALVGVDEEGQAGPSGTVSTWKRSRSCALWVAIPRRPPSAAGKSMGLVYVLKLHGLSLAGVLCTAAAEEDDPETVAASGIHLCRSRARALHQRPERKQ